MRLEASNIFTSRNPERINFDAAANPAGPAPKIHIMSLKTNYHLNSVALDREYSNLDWNLFEIFFKIEKEFQKMIVISFEELQNISHSTKYGGLSSKIKSYIPILSLK